MMLKFILKKVNSDIDKSVESINFTVDVSDSVKIKVDVRSPNDVLLDIIAPLSEDARVPVVSVYHCSAHIHNLAYKLSRLPLFWGGSRTEANAANGLAINGCDFGVDSLGEWYSEASASYFKSIGFRKLVSDDAMAQMISLSRKHFCVIPAEPFPTDSWHHPSTLDACDHGSPVTYTGHLPDRLFVNDITSEISSLYDIFQCNRDKTLTLFNVKIKDEKSNKTFKDVVVGAMINGEMEVFFAHQLSDEFYQRNKEAFLNITNKYPDEIDNLRRLSNANPSILRGAEIPPIGMVTLELSA